MHWNTPPRACSTLSITSIRYSINSNLCTFNGFRFHLNRSIAAAYYDTHGEVASHSSWKLFKPFLNIDAHAQCYTPIADELQKVSYCHNHKNSLLLRPCGFSRSSSLSIFLYLSNKIKLFIRLFKPTRCQFIHASCRSAIPWHHYQCL